MSEKYFAKYLPVEGEIKEGDKTFYKGSNVAFPVILNGYTTIEYFNKGDHKKVKFFLCSRDIQVGDNVVIDGGAFLNIEQDDIAFAKSNNGYRIIGEISPEATWVKEGDKFSEAEVHLYRPLEFSHYEKYFDTESQQEEERPVYKNITAAHIKGPCGHFH